MNVEIVVRTGFSTYVLGNDRLFLWDMYQCYYFKNR